METIGQRIKRLREEKGLSMQALAKLVKVKSWQTIQQWENGSTTPRRSREEPLAQALGISVAELVGHGTLYPSSNRPSAAESPESNVHYTVQWPFPRIDLKRVLRLPAEDREFVERLLLVAIEERESALRKQTPRQAS